MVALGLELINHNRTWEIHLDKTTFSKINSKQDMETKDTETKAMASNKWATTNKTSDNSNSMDNKCMDNNNKTNFKHTNNQTIISVALVTIINNRIVSKPIRINSSKFRDSKDLIISNSNSPLSNKTPIRVRHLICFENAP